jgi:hypothetical protein
MADGEVSKHRDAYAAELDHAAEALDRESSASRDVIERTLRRAEASLDAAKRICGDVPLPPLE